MKSRGIFLGSLCSLGFVRPSDLGLLLKLLSWFLLPTSPFGRKVRLDARRQLLDGVNPCSLLDLVATNIFGLQRHGFSWLLSLLEFWLAAFTGQGMTPWDRFWRLLSLVNTALEFYIGVRIWSSVTHRRWDPFSTLWDDQVINIPRRDFEDSFFFSTISKWRFCFTLIFTSKYWR